LEHGDTPKVPEVVLSPAIGKRLMKARRESGAAMSDSVMRLWAETVGVPAEWLDRGLTADELAETVQIKRFASLYS
jgi:hypothetical protein